MKSLVNQVSVNSKVLFAVMSCFLAVNLCASAQGTAREEMSRGESAVSEAKTAKSMADAMLAAKGWNEGGNKNTNGAQFYVALGSGVIQAPIDDPAYLTSRANAYDKAMLNAWAEIRKFLGEQIATAAKSSYEEATGSMGGEDQSVSKDKTTSLLNQALESSLKKTGIDPASATTEQKDKAIATEEFAKSIGTVAAGPVIGVQNFATFEGRGDGKGYQIVVVAVWSDKLQAMAESMLTCRKVPVGTPGKPVAQWIPQEPSTLITTFGVQMVSDEKGFPVLLSFGQSRPLTDTSRSTDAARSKALMEAKSYLRTFAGTQAKVIEDFNKAETSKEFANSTKSYTSSESFAQSIDALAPASKFSGIAMVKSWTYKHPITKKTMVGVVAMWRPESALLANRIATGMDAAPKGNVTAVAIPEAKGIAPDSTIRRSMDDSDKGRTGSGAAASDDF